MTRDEFERIAEAVFDGTANAREREQLDAYVATDPQAAEIWADLRVAHVALADADLEPAPAGLRGEILRSIRFPRAERSSWWSEVIASFRARPVLAYGSTFAVGLAVGILAIGTWRGGFEASKQLAPSTVATTTFHAQPEAAAPVAIEVGGADIAVSTAQSPDGATVTIASNKGAADVTLAWDPAHHEMAGLNGGSGEVVATESGWAVIRLVPGSQWNLALRRSAADGGDVRITVRVGDNEERRSIRLPG
jgi:hypothetical protein